MLYSIRYTETLKLHMKQVIGNLKLFGSILTELTIKMKRGDNEQCPE